MQQLWTLQEGFLAQKLIFEFSDGLVALEELLPMGKERLEPMLVDLSKEVFQRTKQQKCNISDVLLGGKVQVKQAMKPLQSVGY